MNAGGDRTRENKIIVMYRCHSRARQTQNRNANTGVDSRGRKRAQTKDKTTETRQLHRSRSRPSAIRCHLRFASRLRCPSGRHHRVIDDDVGAAGSSAVAGAVEMDYTAHTKTKRTSDQTLTSGRIDKRTCQAHTPGIAEPGGRHEPRNKWEAGECPGYAGQPGRLEEWLLYPGQWQGQ